MTVAEHMTIQTIDGADDDGGTLYVLYDHQGGLVTSSPWPQILEAIAKVCGYDVVRTTYSSSEWDGVDLEGALMKRVKSTKGDVVSPSTTPIGEQELTVTCVHCAWRYEGTRDGAREAYGLHLLMHPNQDTFDVRWPPPAGTQLDAESARGAGVIVARSSSMKQEPRTTNGPRPPWTRERVILAIQAFHDRHGRIPTQKELTGEHFLPSHAILRRLFGTQNEAIKAAGYEPTVHGGRAARAAGVKQPRKAARKRAKRTVTTTRKPTPPRKPDQEVLLDGNPISRLQDAERDLAAARVELEVLRERVISRRADAIAWLQQQQVEEE